MLLTNYTKTTITNQPVPRLPFIVIVILLAWRSGRGIASELIQKRLKCITGGLPKQKQVA